MKQSTHIVFSAAAGILLLAGICFSQQVTAQNFNHSNFNAGNNRSAAPAQPTRSNAAPVQQDNRNMNNGGNKQAAPATAPVQQDNRNMNNGGNKQAAPATAPVQQDNRYMNNGGANRPGAPAVREEPKPNYNQAPQENRNNNNYGDNRYANPASRNDRGNGNMQGYDNRTINGGGRNIGNHDFHPEVRENIEIRGNNNYRENDHENIYHTGSYRGLRPYNYHPYRPFYWGPSWHPFGFFLPYLSANAFRFYMGNQWYYYDNGCYYLPSGGRYTVVAPPIGATVNYLPDGYETPIVGNDTYYYYGGIFYVYNGQNYQVVPAPVGAIVNQLPVGVQEQQINGQDIMVYNNVYYQPISMNGYDSYEVVQSNQ